MAIKGLTGFLMQKVRIGTVFTLPLQSRLN